MNKNHLLAAAAALMLAAVAVPTSADSIDWSADACADVRDDDTKDLLGNSADLGADGVTCQVATGPGSVTVKGVAGVGLGVCFVDSAMPLACSANPGDLASAGAAFFNVTGEDGNWAAAGRELTVWVKFIPGVGEGYRVLACADRDDSDVCTNVGSTIDDLYSAFNEGTMVSGSKEEKTDPDAVELTGCFHRDDAAAGGDFDDIVVFIGAYEGVQDDLLNDNTGVGWATGQFEVFLIDTGNDCDTRS